MMCVGVCMHDVCRGLVCMVRVGGLVCMMCVGLVCMLCVGLVCMMLVHKMCAVCLKSLCVCKHDVIVLFLQMRCVSACMQFECVSGLAELVFAAMHVFCVRLCVNYMVLVVSAVSVWRVCMHDLRVLDLYA